MPALYTILQTHLQQRAQELQQRVHHVARQLREDQQRGLHESRLPALHCLTQEGEQLWPPAATAGQRGRRELRDRVADL